VIRPNAASTIDFKEPAIFIFIPATKLQSALLEEIGSLYPIQSIHSVFLKIRFQVRRSE